MVRYGFIGVGGIARNYLGSLARIPDARVVAVHDVDVQRAQAVAEQHEADAHTEHRALLDRDDLDAVCLCIPPFAHERQVAECAQRGLAVFVAKPVALDLPTARANLAALREHAVINQSGYMWRSGDAVLEAQRIIGERALGMGVGQVMVSTPNTPWWRVKAQSGGQVVEQSTHVLDLLRLFLGEVERVQAVGHRGLVPDRADFEDCTAGTFTFGSGAIGTLTSTHSGGDGRYRLVLVGRELLLDLDLAGNRISGRVDGDAVSFAGEENGYYRQLETFTRAVREGNQSLVPTDYADAARTLAATVAFNDAMERGDAVAVEEVK